LGFVPQRQPTINFCNLLQGEVKKIIENVLK
jgi:hypothetical protein